MNSPVARVFPITPSSLVARARSESLALLLSISIVVTITAPIRAKADEASADAPIHGFALKLDSTLRPPVAELERLYSDQHPRPVARLRDPSGRQANFVANELLLFTRDQQLLASALQRWHGTLLPLPQADPNPNQPVPVHLIRVNLQPGEPNPGVQEGGGGSVSVSSQQGLELLTLALRELSGGIPVGLNGFVVPREDWDPVPLSGDPPCPPGTCPFPDPSSLSIEVEFILGLPVGPVFPFDPSPPPVRSTGQSLWVGTYNAQSFPPIPGSFSGCCEDRAGRIEQLADRIRQSDYDIISLNEIFSNEAQWALAGLLGTSSYPHFVQLLDGDGRRTNLDPLNPLLDSRFRNFCSLPVLRLAGVRSCQDSGLMLFSRFRFLPLPDPIPFRADTLRATSMGMPWRSVAFSQFRICSNDAKDCFANKGAALLRVEHPTTGSRFNVVFTHMQAGGSGAAREARRLQFEQIHEMIGETLRDAPPGSQNLILMGDLNTQGDLARELMEGRPEWTDRFSESATEAGGFFFSELRDSWEFQTHDNLEVPPERRDRGLTSSVDGPLEDQRRLDYVLRNFVLDPTTNEPLCYQHMTIAHNLAFSEPGEPVLEGGLGLAGIHSLSDHFGVNANINLSAPFCSSNAPRVVAPGELDNPAGTVLFESTDGSTYEIRHPGGMQWFRVDEPGTYSFALYREDGAPAGTGDVQLRVYASTNLSTPVLPWNGETTEFSDPSGQGRTGVKFHLPAAPFYVRITHADRNRTGPYSLAIHKHQCVSEQDDCILLPNREDPPVFTVPRDAIGWEGSMYFQIATDGPFDDAAQDLIFSISPLVPPGGSGSFRLALIDSEDMSVIDEGASGEYEMSRSDASDNRRKLFLRVETEEDSPPAFRAAWSTNLILLHSFRGDPEDVATPSHVPLSLKCRRQARRPDILGIDDEDVRLQIFLDSTDVVPPDGSPTGRPVYQNLPGLDRRPDLGDFDGGQFKNLEGVLSCPIGFLKDIQFELEAHGGLRDAFVLRSGPAHLSRLVERGIGLEMTIDEVGGAGREGRYRLTGNLSHGTHNLLTDSARLVTGPDGVPALTCNRRSGP